MSKYLCIGLGLFELIACADFYLNTEARVKESALLPPLIATDFTIKILYCAYILTLGFQRLTYGLTSASYKSWLCLLGTHLVEAGLWWSFALAPRFRNGLPIVDLIKNVVTLKSSGGPHAILVLIGVPLLLLSMVLQPPRAGKSKKVE